jgi:hypothetical protein
MRQGDFSVQRIQKPSTSRKDPFSPERFPENGQKAKVSEKEN